jgi:ADP-ribose pyrophosphatase
MTENHKPIMVWTGRYLSMAKCDHWEYVTRRTGKPGVGIVAITDADEVVLVEQYRAPVGHRVVELPAGLAGDIPGAEEEPMLEAAKRELLEETGYLARVWMELAAGYSSPGLTDESIVLFLAEGLEKVGPGGGDSNEAIEVHEVPLGCVLPWLAEQGQDADLKLLAGLYAVQQHRLVG